MTSRPPPPAEALEKLMDAIELTGRDKECCAPFYSQCSHWEDYQAARAALREYVSALFASLESQLERLKAEQPTREEALFCLHQLQDQELDHEHWKTVTAKLRRLSQSEQPQ